MPTGYSFQLDGTAIYRIEGCRRDRPRLQTHRPKLVDGIGFIVGIDRFMSEARALTNFAGNTVATVLIVSWTREFDADQAGRVLRGEDPLDEATLLARPSLADEYLVA